MSDKTLVIPAVVNLLGIGSNFNTFIAIFNTVSILANGCVIFFIFWILLFTLCRKLFSPDIV